MTEILTEAQSLLVQTFNRHELRQMLFTRMGLDLNAIAPIATGTTDLAFEVSMWMDRRRRVWELVKAAAAERPNVDEWQSLLARVNPPAAPDGQSPILGGVVSAYRPVTPPDEVRALVRGYARLRRTLPSGDQKTVQLQSLVNQLLNLPLEEYELADRLHLSESEGERMTAVLALIRRAETRFLRWLAERIAVENKFVGYQAAVALVAAAKTVPHTDLDAVLAAIESAREWIPEPERQDNGRWKKLQQATEAISLRSRGASV